DRLAGFKAGLAAEWNATAQHAYRLNADQSTAIVGDVTALNGEQILEAAGGALDILDGSPPCQGFSHAGRRQVGDERNALYFQFVRVVRETMPRAFVAENVEGIATGTMREAYFGPALA